MKRTILAILVIGFSLFIPQSAHGIVYGVPDDGEHPNVGSFVGEFTDPETGEVSLFQLCTGTLIDSDVVLSASHCFVGLPETITDITFTLDEVIDADEDGAVDDDVELLSGTPMTHPLFATGGANNTFDIAVFLLDDAVTGITPAALPELGALSDRSLRDETFTAVGYGTVRETNRQSSQAFLPGTQRLKADQELLSVTKAWANFSMNLATGNGGTCYGDSGGPHFLDGVVVALTITGDAPCKALDKTYRLDTPWAQEFLAQFVALP